VLIEQIEESLLKLRVAQAAQPSEMLLERLRARSGMHSSICEVQQCVANKLAVEEPVVALV
jgi:hypothetical protein